MKKLLISFANWGIRKLAGKCADALNLGYAGMIYIKGDNAFIDGFNCTGNEEMGGAVYIDMLSALTVHFGHSECTVTGNRT